MTIRTTTTGSLDLAVASEGFTTFMVRPWENAFSSTRARESDVCLTILVIGHEASVHQIQNIVDVLSIPLSPYHSGNSEFLLRARPAETLSVINALVRWESLWLA